MIDNFKAMILILGLFFLSVGLFFIIGTTIFILLGIILITWSFLSALS